KNRFVAGFIGSPKMNFISVFIDDVEDDQVKVQFANGSSFWIPVDGKNVIRGERMSLGIRPEHLIAAEKADAIIHGDVLVVEKLGYETQIYLTVEDADADIIYRVPDTALVNVGDKFTIGIPAYRCHLFNNDGKACQRLYKEAGA
ncbi:TOBE domain-containing protein, partial [Aliivibrio salmonicida]|uniref:TOBE domain-containing protein n=1 Tax=Aliivibrio salmonicida TaxID=40269 RepID=UPI0005C9F932